MKVRVWSFVFCLFALLYSSPADARRQVQKIVLKDGTVLIGVILRINQSYIRVSTRHGALTIPRRTVRSISFLPAHHPQARAYYGRRRRYYRRYRRRYRYKRRKRFGSGKPKYAMRNPRRGLLITGVILAPIGYGFSILASTIMVNAYRNNNGTNTAERASGYLMLIPVAGPFITLGMSFTTSNLEPLIPIWILLGAAQALGVTFIILGMTAKKRRVRIATHQNSPPPKPLQPPPPPSKSAHALGSFH